MTFSASPEIADEKIEGGHGVELAGENEGEQHRAHFAGALGLVAVVVFATHDRHPQEPFRQVVVLSRCFANPDLILAAFSRTSFFGDCSIVNGASDIIHRSG